mmetsp:Transcript_1441/g.2992  ORF Transcript_1441/g.2992 Transcript_1441/m.2992 type:complete len:108 (-) Transcript_1441:468-791(-)
METNFLYLCILPEGKLEGKKDRPLAAGTSNSLIYFDGLNSSPDLHAGSDPPPPFPLSFSGDIIQEHLPCVCFLSMVRNQPMGRSLQPSRILCGLKERRRRKKGGKNW